MERSQIKAHIQQFTGSGRMLKHLIIERSIEAAHMDYPVDYQPPSQHIIVAPTSDETVLAWNRQCIGARTSAVFRPGDLILNPSGCFTRPQWDRETRFTLVAIEPASVDMVCDELEIPPVEVPLRFHFQNSGLSRTIQRLIHCFESERPFLEKALDLELTLIRQLIGECCIEKDGLSQLSRPKLMIIKDLIRSNLDQSITVEEMASAAGYSISRFLHLFRNTTGFSPHQYLMQERMEKARELLSCTALPVSAIAADCGFADESHLIRLFKRNTGMTPTKFRREGGSKSHL